MRTTKPFRYLVAAALAGSAALTVALPGAVAGAGAVKPPVTVTCSGLFGTSTQQLQTGCVGSAKSKVTSYGVSVPNASDTGATVYWTNKDTTTITFTYSAGNISACSDYLGLAPSDAETETATVTGGNAKLTTGIPYSSNACVYVYGGDILVVAGSNEL